MRNYRTPPLSPSKLAAEPPQKKKCETYIHTYLLNKGLHGGHVNDLEGVHVDGTVLLAVLPDLVEHGHQGDVGLTGAGGGAQQQVLRR